MTSSGTANPRRSRWITATAIAALACGSLLAIGCIVDAQAQGSWGSIALRQGTVHFYWGEAVPGRARAGVSVRFRPTVARFDPDWHDYPARFDSAGAMISPHWWFVRAPLWIPAVTFAAPWIGAAVWRRTRRRPWQCRGCGYDLRGLGAPVCPECGLTTTAARLVPRDAPDQSLTRDAP